MSQRSQGGGGWWSRIWPGRRPKPLQISEVVRAVDEHLQAKALASLETRFLPTAFTVAVSPFDWQSLEPFQGPLLKAIHEVYARLAGGAGYARLIETPEVRLEPRGELSPGAPPALESGFSSFRNEIVEAFWEPGKTFARFDVPAPPPGSASRLVPGVFELTALVDPGDGTLCQSTLLVCLKAELSISLVAAGASSGGKLCLDSRGRVRRAEGGAWSASTAEKLAFSPAPLPIEGMDHAAVTRAVESPVYAFSREGRPDLFWAPGSLLVIGRELGKSHWVPDAVPPNVSGRHFALVLRPGGGLFVCDLASTNGVSVEGARLRPMELVRLRPPAALDIGKEGTLRFEIRPYELEESVGLEDLETQVLPAPQTSGGTVLEP